MLSKITSAFLVHEVEIVTLDSIRKGSVEVGGSIQAKDESEGR